MALFACRKRKGCRIIFEDCDYLFLYPGIGFVNFLYMGKVNLTDLFLFVCSSEIVFRASLTDIVAKLGKRLCK